MKAVVIEVRGRVQDKELPKEGGETLTLNTRYSKNVKVCEGYVLNNTKSVFFDKNKRLTEGNVLPDKIIKYNYKYHKNSKLIKLPSKDYKNFWDNLILNEEEKFKGLDYLLFLENLEEKKISLKNMGINKCILISGPPGVGKSTLARALAQKLSIRTKPLFLFDIDCSTIFSKYYGQSSVKIDEIFAKMKGKRCIIIIDEVESVLMSRQKCMDSNDPIDSIRAVNTFLTNIDKLKAQKNVYFIYTSNFSEKLDPAFKDRIDIKIEMGKMDEKTKHKFISIILEELMEKNLLETEKIPNYEYDKIVGQESFLLNFVKNYQIKSPRNFKKEIIEKLVKSPKTWKDLLNLILNKIKVE